MPDGFASATPKVRRRRFEDAFTDMAGRETTASYGANNLISSFVQTSGINSSGYHYTYYSAGVNINRLQYVTLKATGPTCVGPATIITMEAIHLEALVI